MIIFRKMGFSKLRIGSSTFFMRDGAADANGGLLQQMRSTLQQTSDERMNVISRVHPGPAVFIKARCLRHRNHRIKATLARFRLRSSSPAIAEIVNHINSANVSYIPKLVAFGYEKNRYGLIERVVIATEYCENSMTLREFLERFPDRRELAVTRALEVVGQKLEDGILHLDCWIENLLTDDQLSQMWLIDLEYCKVGSKASIEDQLGFCLGYLYNYRLHEYLPRDTYFSLARDWLEGKQQCVESVLAKAFVSADTPPSRKERMLTF